MRARWLVGGMVVVFLARLVVALFLGDTVEVLPGIYDQVSYHTLAVRVLEGHGFTFAQAWWPLTPAGQPTAHWSYLYTLLLAGLYALFGVHPLTPRLFQAVAAGVMMPWLTYRISRRAFPSISAAGQRASGTPKGQDSRSGAIVAAAWTAVYGYFVYYAAALVTETFYIMGILWTLDVAFRCLPSQTANLERSGVIVGDLRRRSGRRRADWLTWLELGFAIGVTSLLRQVFLLFVPFLFAWLLWVQLVQGAGTLRERVRAWRVSIAPVARGGLITGAVVAAIIAPITLFNYRQFGRFVLLNTNAGYAFYWANHPVYGDHFVPTLGVTPDMPTYQELIPAELRHLNEAELDSALLGRAIGFVVEDPVRYLRLSLSRLPVYFKFWPSPESHPLSNIVRVGSFGLALPFMLAGVGLWIADAAKGVRHPGSDPRGGPGSPAGLLLLFALVYSAIHLLSWALIRYRLPVDAVMLVFGGRAVVALWHRLLSLSSVRRPRSNSYPVAGG